MSARYDFIIAGGGLSGLSLACQLNASSLAPCSILVVDRDRKERNDRTWSFWSNKPMPFDDLVSHSWDRLRIKSAAGDQVVGLGRYRYQMIRGLDLYRSVRSRLESQVEFVHGSVDGIADAGDGVRVSVGGQAYQGKWAFDSRFRLSDLHRALSGAYSFEQHFGGWRIETPKAAFDPQTATLFDFPADQSHGLRFFYLLPTTDRQALVEYVTLGREDFNRELHGYISNVLGIRDYRVVSREGGANPLTDHAFPRRIGRRVMAIGALGGRVKPTSGYAFTRIQRDSAAIVESLLRCGHPFAVPPDGSFYRRCDSLLLQLMCERGDQVASLLALLFEHNPIERVFRFLDEETSPCENVALMHSLPPLPFLQALARRTLGRLVHHTSAVPFKSQS